MPSGAMSTPWANPKGLPAENYPRRASRRHAISAVLPANFSYREHGRRQVISPCDWRYSRIDEALNRRARCAVIQSLPASNGYAEALEHFQVAVQRGQIPYHI